MVRLSYKTRASLPKGEFAIPAKAPASGSYPLDTANRARDALSRVSANGTSAEKAKVRTAVARKYPDIGKAGDVPDYRMPKGKK